MEKSGRSGERMDRNPVIVERALLYPEAQTRGGDRNSPYPGIEERFADRKIVADHLTSFRLARTVKK